MDPWVWIVIVVVVVAVLAFVILQLQRQRKVQEKFGPEYDRTVKETGSRREAVSELREREARREELEIRPLEQESAELYAASWKETQARFVDYPGEAIREADSLVAQVMKERGYPVETFEQRSADISVDHPQLVDNYRAAHAISLANDNDEATTEDLRQAMVHYRSLFEELLETRR
jgi:predicted nucleic acid-binding protein